LFLLLLFLLVIPEGDLLLQLQLQLQLLLQSLLQLQLLFACHSERSEEPPHFASATTNLD
jgi:uncharacterized coiled-coil protein SlyX